eukprot:CFRG4031T1
MFKNTFQSGMLSVLYSIGSKPLQIWEKSPSNGSCTKRVLDDQIQSLVIELSSDDILNTYISCPADPQLTLGIKLPYLVLMVKNMDKYFSFEAEVLDDRNITRRFRASNYQTAVRVKPFLCTLPLRMDDGWNLIQINLSDLVKTAYGTSYAETCRIQIHPNCRIRRVYFADRLYSEEELPSEFRLYYPVNK